MQQGQVSIPPPTRQQYSYRGFLKKIKCYTVSIFQVIYYV